MEVVVSGLSRLPASARRPALLKRACLAALGPKGKRPGELNLVFLDRRRMLELNKRYLGRDHDTDVIAFAYPPSPAPRPPFGDVFVSVHQAKRQARELGHPLLRELLTLAVHGTLHLIGFDDHAPADRRRMFARQDRVLARLDG